MSIQEQRRQLPVYAARKRLLKELSKRSNAILLGETGSGKTTQVPQVEFLASLYLVKMFENFLPKFILA